ncbi:MAG: hypothetical protein K5989_03205 [Lachnospiraceae bacterium]|nr:hypothetical protein [Lachnospiraceae bacterium]
MAKSLYEIRMNFRAAKRIADNLQALGNKLRTVSEERYGGTLRNISNNWKGENATAYLNKGNVLKGKMTNTAGDLIKAAETIRTIARNTYEAEMNAYRIASTRNSS